MTQEQKAKAYDEALERARRLNVDNMLSNEAIEEIFPEVAEREDERIRKFLIQHISGWIGCIEHDLKNSSKDIESEKELAMFKAGLAYLEKQKESLPISEICKENANSFADGIIEVRSFQRGMEEGRRLERQKEQKQAQTSEEKEYIRTIKSIISDFIRDKRHVNLAYYQRIYDWLDGRHVPFSCGHENGQPVDPVFSKQEYESHPIISKDTTSTKPVEFDGKTLLYTADKSYQIGFRDGVASVKPAEWSESDKDVLMDAICATDKLGNNEVYNKNNPNLAKAFRVAKDWLKNLPERFNLQPKQEWSEEDEKDVAHIIRILDDCYAYGKHDLSKTDHENLVGTLKSLRLQPKLEWSEEDEHRRDGIIQWLREYQAKFNPKYDSLSIESIESLIDWLKSIRPSWKPSEKQMEELNKARRFIPYNCDVLESLYIQLKNL